MTNQKRLSQTPLSPQEGLLDLEKQDLERVTGGAIDPTPLLSAAKNTVAKVTKGSSSTYLPPHLDLEIREPKRQVIDQLAAKGGVARMYADRLKEKLP